MRVSGHDESATATVCTKIMYHHINCIVYVLITLNHGQSAVLYTCNMSSRPIYDPQPHKISPKKCHIRSRFWRIMSTIFVQTLSYMTQLRVYIIRRQQYAVVTVVNTCNNSNRLIYDPQPDKNTQK